MRTLPKTLIASMASAAVLFVVAPSTLAHGSGDAHPMPGAGGTMGPGMMGEMGEGMMDLMGGWMSGQGRGEHPGIGAGAPMGPQMPAMPETPGEGGGSSRTGEGTSGGKTALQILEERLARGEIDKDDFEARERALSG